jgi:membrane protease YdiL (CAAX protease family)
MNHLKNSTRALVTPAIVMLGVGLFAAIFSPALWSLLNGEYLLEKVFQKTGLLLLTLLAIHQVRTSIFAPQPDTIKLSISKQLIRFSQSWLIGVLILSVPIYLLLAMEIRVADTQVVISSTKISRHLISALWIGLIVGLIEEYVFRGWLLGWLQSKLNTIQSIGQTSAVILSAFYFALLHFLKPVVDHNNQNDSISAGFDVFLRSLKHLINHSDWDTFIALFLAGILLGLIKTLYNNGLILVIGIHAGWIFSIKATKSLTNSNPGNQWQFLVGQDGIVGYLSAGWLGIIILSLCIYWHFQKTKQQRTYKKLQ